MEVLIIQKEAFEEMAAKFSLPIGNWQTTYKRYFALQWHCGESIMPA